jgi:hypothetical protein
MILTNYLPNECIDRIYDYMDLFSLLMIYSKLPEWKRKEIQWQLHGQDSFMSWYYTPHRAIKCSSIHLVSFEIPLSYVTCSFLSFIQSIKPKSFEFFYSYVAKKGDVPLYKWLINKQSPSKLAVHGSLKNACIEGHIDMIDFLEEKYPSTLNIIPNEIILHPTHTSFFKAHLLEYLHNQKKWAIDPYGFELCITKDDWILLHHWITNKYPIYPPSLLRTLTYWEHRNTVQDLVDMPLATLYPELHSIIQSVRHVIYQPIPKKGQTLYVQPMRFSFTNQEKETFWKEWLEKPTFPGHKVYKNWLYRCLFDRSYPSA